MRTMANFKMMTRPVKKKADGGEFDWSGLNNKIGGTQYAVAPSLANVGASMNPVTANPIVNPNVGPLATNAPSINAAPSTAPSSSIFSSLGKAGSAIAPFASNIVNAMRTPPQPPIPHLDSAITLRSPSFNNERAEAERNTNADAEAAARGVDGNTGAKIRLFATGQKYDRLSSINERDKNMQLQTQNEQSRANAGVSQLNNRKLDEYGQQQVERRIAQQQQQSANLSNLSDKVVGIQNENEKRRIELQKTRTMSTLFGKSGVGDRERKLLKEIGVDDPMGNDYKDIKRNGGFFRGLPLRAQTLKSLYKRPS